VIKRILFGAALAVIFASQSIPALAAGNGVIEGNVANKTPGGGSVANVEVSLTTNQNDKELGKATTKTDAAGHFSFTGLATDSSYSYQVDILDYQEAEYDGTRFGFSANETTRNLEISVYDATQDDSVLNVAAAHTVIYVGKGSLDVMEYYQISNESNYAYVGTGEITPTGKRKTVTYPVAAKASGVQYGGDLMQCCILPGQTAFTDTMPFIPGSREVVYSYRVDYSGTDYDYSRKTNLPTQAYELLVQGEASQVASDQLVPSGPVSYDGSSFQRYSATSLARGAEMSALLSGLPKGGKQWTLIWAVAVAAVAVGAGVYFARPLLRRTAAPRPAGVAAEDRAERRRRLLVEIARLDDDFAAGRVREAAYHRERQARKADVMRLSRR